MSFFGSCLDNDPNIGRSKARLKICFTLEENYYYYLCKCLPYALHIPDNMLLKRDFSRLEQKTSNNFLILQTKQVVV